MLIKFGMNYPQSGECRSQEWFFKHAPGIIKDLFWQMTAFLSIIHESADILYYDNGYPYIHDILTNNTDNTITETEYCMLAYDMNGMPLKLYWNFWDSSAECSYAYAVRTDNVNILPCQTENYNGGWSLYDGEKMADYPQAGNGEADQAAYSLFCLKEVVFENGSVWSNRDYDHFSRLMQAGK